MILGLIVLFAAFYNEKQSKLYSYIKTVICWMVVMYLGLELLSLFKVISFSSSALLWGLFDIGLIIYLIKNRKIRKIRFTLHFSIETIVLGIIAVITLFFALKSVPNNFDSMTYHLSRIMHWEQNGSVAHYSSHILRQVSSPVLAEFINLYVYILSGKKDIFFNLVQWSAYITDAILVMGIAAKLKCNRISSFLAGILFLTMPIAVAESMTTQNDLLVGMWCLFFVYIILDFYEGERLEFNKTVIEKTILLSLCIAFGYLTKPSSMFAFLFFAIGLLIICIVQRNKMCSVTKLIGIAVGTTGITVLPELLRNIHSFHAFSDPIAGANQLVGTLNIRYLFINFLKNFSYNCPNILVDVSKIVEHAIFYMAYLLGVEINDIAIAEAGTDFFMHEARVFHHDYAVNPVVFGGLLCAIIAGLYLLIKRKLSKAVTMYCLMTLLSFVGLCVFLRWEQFVTRYMIAFLALCCPMIVIMIDSLWNLGKQKYYWAVTGIIFFLSFVEFMNMVSYHYNESKWSTGERSVEYFHNWKEEKYPVYVEIASHVREQGYSQMGLLVSENSYEYPIWTLLRKDDVVIEDIDVQNATSLYESKDFVPDCILIDKTAGITEYTYHGQNYYYSGVGDDYTYLLEKG